MQVYGVMYLFNCKMVNSVMKHSSIESLNLNMSDAIGVWGPGFDSKIAHFDKKNCS